MVLSDEEAIRRNLEKQPLKGEWMRTGRVPYPKHVWSPAGGWYGQPANWKSNTAVFLVLTGVFIGCTWYASAQLEERPRMPEPGAFYPSRYWSKQILEHERKLKENTDSQKSS